MVRVVRLHALGGPDVLRVDDVTVDEPQLHEARIRTGAIGLNRIEAVYRAGGFGVPTFPARIGYEAAGIVEAVGADVRNVQVGDRVATVPGLSMEEYGVYAEAFCYPASMLIKLAPSVPIDGAAASWMAFLTAYALAETPSIEPDDFVVLTAASSSVALAALQVVKAEGGIPIAVTRTRAKADALVAAGFKHVIASDANDIATEIKRITGGNGAALAFDAVAGAMIPALANALKPGGEIIVYGALSDDAAAMPVHMMMLNGLTVRGFSANQVTLDPTRLRRAVKYIEDRLADGRFKPIIDKRFALDDIATAHAYLESNAQVGKVIVTVD